MLQELIEFNLQQGRKEVITLAQTLLIKLTAENIGANDHLNQILCDRIKLCLTTQAANMMSVSFTILITTWKLFRGTHQGIMYFLVIVVTSFLRTFVEDKLFWIFSNISRISSQIFNYSGILSRAREFRR